MFVCAVLFSSRSICIFIATTLHYFQLVVAFWFNVMSFDVCKAFINLVEQRSGADKSKKAPQVGATDTKKKTFKIYSCYAWGFPFVVVAASHVADQLSVLEDYRPAYAGHVDQPGNHMCWFNNKMGYGMFFALPVATLMLENFLLFVTTLVCMFNKDR